LHCKGRNAAGHWHTKLTQDFLALVLVDLHEVSLEGGYSHQPVRVICPKQALDTSAGDCIMLQRTNLEPGHLH